MRVSWSKTPRDALTRLCLPGDAVSSLVFLTEKPRHPVLPTSEPWEQPRNPQEANEVAAFLEEIKCFCLCKQMHTGTPTIMVADDSQSIPECGLLP